MEEKLINSNSSDKLIDSINSESSNSSLKGFGLNEKGIKYNNHKNKLNSNKPSKCNEFCTWLFPCCRKIDTVTKRTTLFKDSHLNYSPLTNKILNHKYNFLTFIPVVLFNQFKFFGNYFYLIMTITQFFDQLKVGFLFSYLSPLVIVVGVSMLKELYDDINRRIQDKRTNNEEYIVHFRSSIEPNKSSQKLIKSKDIQIGDIIELKENQRVPADMLLLKTCNESGDNHTFIRTDQGDGETDWKLRKAPGLTQEMEIFEIMKLDGFIEYQPPSKGIYSFEGVLQYGEENNNKLKKESLGLENTIWASTIGASKKVVGVVIYIGDETRARMNSSTPKGKVGIGDIELNRGNFYLFVIMMILSMILTILKNVWNWTALFTFFRFIILFCAIIPISLRVNLDFSKTGFSIQINWDTSISGTIARNSTIPEELGRITYVFSDKTGTLTKNEMIFKQIAMETDQFGEDSFNDLSTILEDDCKAADAPGGDLIKSSEVRDSQKGKPSQSIINNEMLSMSKTDNNNNQEINTYSRNRLLTSYGSSDERKVKSGRRNRTKMIRDTITAMVLCNNVTPIMDSTNNTKITYQASSPDEVALVKFAELLNMKLIYRTDSMIRIKNANNVEEEYEILSNFPFSSDTKRMGILGKNKKHGHIIFYLKGAESVIEKYVKEEYKAYIKENAENLALKGLRTLVLTQKIISNDFYNDWLIKYNNAITSMENRKEKISETVSGLENNMDFLCVTGVEDGGQDDVNITLENLRNAGMKIWMLTGDKIETATCISISAGLKAKNHKIFTIRYDSLEHLSIEKDVEKVMECLEKYNRGEENSHLFIIDGDSGDLALNHLEREFFETVMKAPSVVCCRCSPTQKRIIVKTIKKYTDKRTAAVGDGGNDVAMIQEADVGIGIVGKEGLQASFASDFSILQFNYLNTLLLWWGRIGYKNTSAMANFVIHRGMIISLIQFIFSLVFYYNAVALYNGVLILGYSTLYTNFPAVSVLLDRDSDKENIMKFPKGYERLLQGREGSLKNFLWWVFKSIFQATVIMFGALYLFEFLFGNIVTVTFTALIFVELLNVYTEIQKFNRYMFISLFGTGVFYLLTLFLFPAIGDVAFIFDTLIGGKILILAMVCWVPFYGMNQLKKCIFPETYEKLNLISEGK